MLHAINRRRMLFIPSLKVSMGLSTSQQCKEEVMFNHFVNLLGQTQARAASLNWEHLGYEHHDLSELEDLFEEEEINKVIMHRPNEKAPGPDSFIGLFYKKMLGNHPFGPCGSTWRIPLPKDPEAGIDL
jgi:hypothetical protein